MAHSGTIITENEPVGVLSDLQPVLGTTYKSLETVGKYADTNMWSLWKPFRSSATSFANRDARRAALEAANNGLNLNVHQSTMSAVITAAYNAIASLSDAARAAWTDWSYNRPRGGNNNPPEYFREMDWWGYNHAAIAPLHWHFPSQVASSTATDLVEDGSFDMGESSFPELSGKRLGIALRLNNAAGTWMYHICAAGERRVTTPGTGTYDCFFFYTTLAASSAWTIGLNQNNTTIILCPTPWSRMVVAGSSFASVTGLNPSVSSGKFRFELKVNGASLIGMSITYRKYGHFSKTGSDTYTLNPISSGETDTSIGNVSAGYDAYVTTNQPCTDADQCLVEGQFFYTSTNEGNWRLLNIEQSIR